MDNIKQQLEALGPQINSILQISGSPGLSLGVIHKGTIIYTAHFGTRNAEDSTQSNNRTIHTVASLTKPITAAAIAKLVYENKLDWDIPIRQYLPAFRIRQDEIGTRATLRDLLSLRTGIAPANTFWGFQNNEVLMEKSDKASTATYIGAAKPFGQFVYSQWNYSLIDDVVKEVTGVFVGEYIEQNIFRPLKMTRSSFGELPKSECNVAHTHCTHDDGTASRKPDATSAINKSGIGAGGGARSSLEDYMILLQALLHAHKSQVDHNVDSTPGSVFPLTRALFKAHVGLGPPQRSGIEHVAYCMGMYRTKLPGYLSLASPNFYYTLGKEKLAPYGKTLAGTEIYHQSGTALGHLAALFLVPSTESAVVAFTNSQPLIDPADFVAQLALSVLLGEAPAVDLVKMANIARETTLKNYEILEKVVAKGKTNIPPTKPLTAYAGDYYNAIHNFVLSVTVSGDGLKVRIQRGSSSFVLSPYDGETFYWPVNREEEMCTKGMFGFMYKDWHLFRFETNSNGDVDRLLWRHDPYLANPEMFTKTPTKQTFARL